MAKSTVSKEDVKADVPASPEGVRPMSPGNNQLTRTAPEPVPPRQPLISFDRWFASKKFKPHWKAGMVAFANTNIRRTAEQWDETFRSY